MKVYQSNKDSKCTPEQNTQSNITTTNACVIVQDGFTDEEACDNVLASTDPPKYFIASIY